MQFFLHKGKTAKERQPKIQKMGAKETITLRTVNYWFDKLVKIDPNGVVAGRKFYVMFNFTQSRDLMLFMFSSRMNWILDSAQYFSNSHIVFRLNWIPFGFLWNPSTLRSRSDRICLKQKIPQNCFSPLEQNFRSHKICRRGENTVWCKTWNVVCMNFQRRDHKT